MILYLDISINISKKYLPAGKKLRRWAIRLSHCTWKRKQQRIWKEKRLQMTLSEALLFTTWISTWKPWAVGWTSFIMISCNCNTLWSTNRSFLRIINEISYFDDVIAELLAMIRMSENKMKYRSSSFFLLCFFNAPSLIRFLWGSSN